MDLKDGLVKMKGWSRLKFLDFVNLKNVHLGHHDGLDKPVILKKLAHNAEWENVDNKICTDANRPLGCDVARVLDKMKVTNLIQREGLQPKHLKDLNYMFSMSHLQPDRQDIQILQREGLPGASGNDVQR